MIMVALEIGVFRQRWFWAAVPRSDVGIYYVLEEQIQSSNTKPKIIVFGDSRARSGVFSYLLEQKSGLKRGEVINLSLTAGTPWDAKLFIKRNPQLMDSVLLVLYQPSDWQFNENFPPINRVRHFATLAERFSYERFSTKVELLSGFFIHAIAAREVAKGHLRRLMNNTVKLITGKYHPQPPLVDSITGRVMYRMDESEIGPDSVDVTDDLVSFYRDFSYSNRVAGDIIDIITLTRQAGSEFVFIDIPTRMCYVEAVKDSFNREYNEYRDSLTSLASRYEIPIWGDSTTKVQAGITENLYYDYGHLTLEGMRRYSSWLAERMNSFLE